MAKPWQQSLLSSGLPLESDILAYLESKKSCVAKFHYSYLKADELAIEREFSYDIDASYIRHRYFMDLMVECKYRHPGTRWVFAPGSYGGFGELDKNDFLHPFDHFVKPTFPYSGRFPRELAPVCTKATELLPDGTNEKSVTQAVYQLAYALATKIESAVEHQVERLLVDDHIFFHIPIIATTAALHRLNDGVRIHDIRQAKELDEVATCEPCLILSYDIGAELYRHNMQVFAGLRRRLGDEKLKKSLSTFTKDLDHFFSVMARHYCPRAIVVLTVDANQTGFEKLFAYLDNIVSPSPDLLIELKTQEEEFQALVASLPAIKPPRRKKGK